MREDKKIFGLVLARGGSKTVPRKNIKELNGKPLMSYIIEEAKKSKYLKEIWVSSDDDEILQVAGSLMVNTIRRPVELSSGTSKSIEAIQHFMESERVLADHPCDIIVLLNACCPLTTVEDIDGAIELALETGVDSVTSLVEDFSSHPSKVCYLVEGRIQPLGKEFITGERQKITPVYKRNTAIYLAERELVEKGKLFSRNTKGYVMPKERSWDINDMWDWEVAEFLIRSVSLAE